MKMLSSFFNSVDQEKIKHLSGLIDAGVQFTELLKSRSHEVEEVTTETLALYATMTRNQYLLSRVYSAEGGYKLIREYTTELRAFVGGHLRSLLHNPLGIVVRYFLADMVNRPRSIHHNIDQLELLEFDILNKCRGYLEYKPNKFADNDLTEANLTPLYDELMALVNLLRGGADKRNLIRRTPSVVYYSDESEIRFEQSANYVTITYLIMKVAQAILIGESGFDDDYRKDRNELDQEFIIRDFNRISNGGTMKLTNMLCCFNQPKFFPVCVTDTNIPLDFVEKELLRNGLLMTKLAAKF